LFSVVDLLLLIFFDCPVFISILVSVADPGCLSRISDPGYNNGNKIGGGEKFVVLPFFIATKKYNKTENYFIFESEKKII
jgi:hypothetical protein